MGRMNFLRTSPLSLVSPCIALALAAPLAAQWPTGTSTHLAVADAASDQGQPKMVVAPDGGVWISWFDGIASGWDVRVQRLDPFGVEVFAHQGVLVADRSFSSTQDYGLATDAQGYALLAYRSDVGGSTEVYASKVAPDGALLWGAGGVPLTTGAGFVAAPKIVATVDGGAIVAWTENNETRLQRLDAMGAPVWAGPTVLSPGAGAYFLADLQPSGDGAIVSVVHQTGGFTSPRHLKAQRIDGTGALSWGSSPVDIFTGGSLQFGNFPAFVPDGSGGAVFAWYSSSPSLQAFAQRVDALGSPMWSAGGVPVATTAGRLRTSPHVAFDAADQSTYVVWTELNGSQSQRGVAAQRFDGTGNRLWTNDGSQVVPLGSDDIQQTRVLIDGQGTGVQLAWNAAPSFGQDQYLGVHLTLTGVPNFSTYSIASAPSSKADLAVARTATHQAVYAWSDDRTDGGDILVQSFHVLGLPGGLPAIGSAYCTPVPNSTGATGVLTVFGAADASLNEVNLLATGLPHRQFGIFLTSQTQGVIAQPGNSQGVLCLDVSIGRYNQIPQIFSTGDFGTGHLEIDLTQTPTPTTPVAVMAGETWNFQAWHRDLNPGSTSNFTDAVSVAF